MRTVKLVFGSLVAFGALLGACSSSEPGSAPLDGSVSTAAASAPPSPSAGRPADAVRVVPARREGQALVRSEAEAALYLADEDSGLLRRLALTRELTDPPPLSDPPAAAVDVAATETSVKLPGRPAQVLSLGDVVLVTVRDPGLLLVLRAGELSELARVDLPPDAWGLAVSPDGASAYVSSAWTHKVSKVDLAAKKVVWSVDVAREPRGVTVSADGRTVWVSHLIGADITVIQDGTEPSVARVPLPPDPAETLAGETISASLGYAATLAPDGRRLFVARHALGAFWGWQGNPTVDVLVTATSRPLAPARKGRPMGTFTTEDMSRMPWLADASGMRAESDAARWQQPRAMIYRKKTHHLLVASEGQARLAELDALSVSPGLVTNRYYRLGGLFPKDPTTIQMPARCGAPTGVALSEDEDVAWVYCRTTDNVVAVRLTPDGERALRKEVTFVAEGAFQDRLSPWGPFAYAALAVEPRSEALAIGRRLYFDATEPVVSEAMACAGCHPDGRDDGHVWREQPNKNGGPHDANFLAGPSLSLPRFGGSADEPQVFGYARQTPMLAGRVDAPGPYGWHGESPSLVERIRAGFGLHRSDLLRTDGQTLATRANPIAQFVREGLVPPPRTKRALTEQEERGKAIFSSQKAQCATCHPADRGYTDRSVVPLPKKTPKLFTEDPNPAFKVPSLLFVGGTAPYYHDGSAATLADLVEHNGDHMGKTSHLDAADKAALVAYLETL
jgi:cytochrome c peroxidase